MHSRVKMCFSSFVVGYILADTANIEFYTLHAAFFPL